MSCHETQRLSQLSSLPSRYSASTQASQSKYMEYVTPRTPHLPIGDAAISHIQIAILSCAPLRKFRACRVVIATTSGHTHDLETPVRTSDLVLHNRLPGVIPAANTRTSALAPAPCLDLRLHRPPFQDRVHMPVHHWTTCHMLLQNSSRGILFSQAPLLPSRKPASSAVN
jgi:hypothetical protein